MKIIGTYTTNAGDRLDVIAQRIYGHQSGVVELILDANEQTGIAPTLVFGAGVVLKLPEMPAKSDVVRTRRMVAG